MLEGHRCFMQRSREDAAKFSGIEKHLVHGVILDCRADRLEVEEDVNVHALRTILDQWRS
jgi:hypothetical protein